MKSAAHRRQLLRIHLSTAVVLMFVAGTLLGLNLRYDRNSWYSDEGAIVHEITSDVYMVLRERIVRSGAQEGFIYRIQRIGWPMVTYSSKQDEEGWGIIDHGAAGRVIDLNGSEDFRGTGLSMFGILIDAFVAVAILFSTVFLCEWRIRSKRSRYETMKL